MFHLNPKIAEEAFLVAIRQVLRKWKDSPEGASTKTSKKENARAEDSEPDVHRP